MKALEKIRAAIRRKKADALFVTQPENRRYLSGYTATDLSITESSGALLIPTKGTPLLLTDSRYQLQAEQEAAGFKVVRVQQNILKDLVRIVHRLKVRKLAFESHYLLYTTAKKLMDQGRKHGIEMIPVSSMIERYRVIKSADEIKKIHKSVMLNEQVFQEVYADLRPGQTEKEVALEIEATMLRRGAEAPAFPTIVAAGPNAAMPHAIPTDRVIKIGETVIIDMGLKLDGYCSDMTRTVVLGKPDNRTLKVIRLVGRAQRAALKTIKAGIPTCDADRAARDIISRAGYGKNFGHGLGHGVGLAVHEAPSLNRKRSNKLQSGMVITVEPGIYVRGWGGVRLENMVVVNDYGCTILNRDTTFFDI